MFANGNLTNDIIKNIKANLLCSVIFISDIKAKSTFNNKDNIRFKKL